jgi:FAD/FMN-containing dehydrogenase
MVERAPAGSLGNLDAWGLNGPDLALMRKLKQTYDSAGILNPGRYVGRL